MTVQGQADRVRAVADAVLYEGYLLYPYRASSRKNHSRWQFGVLGPPGAAAAGIGEEPALATQCVLRPLRADATIDVVVRFLQLQTRTVQRRDGDDYVTVAELTVAGRSWIGWDEAVECEIPLGPLPVTELAVPRTVPVAVPGGADIELLTAADGAVTGRVVRTRWPVHAVVRVERGPSAGTGAAMRLDLAVENTGDAPVDATDALRRSLIGAHLILAARGGRFVSLLEPPADVAGLADECAHTRCFPVLAGDADPATPGESATLLVSPIILYDHPQVAEQSGGDLFDATEIDEILTLRVLTLTDEEKAEARATDPRAAQIVERCETMTPAEMQALHGILRDPHREGGLIPELPDGVDWWTPEADTSVRPETDGVLIGGIRVAQGSLVRLHPSRRADAQDLFFRDRVARVATVHADVDGETHVGVVLVDDPAADLHDWYGRYLYFAPDELEPLGRKEEP
ncbi:hypothetical protein A4U64_21830 [Rhodococcus sp. WB1]|uniref:hypothetical protein n=1 Tax=Rhodococcus sp. WB1 TaxID=1033922 RepID=UPI00081A9F3A|nr:hypothetical protein [Rhodococcus sp. WB1]ANZ27033.1 hypothetical protein A4U64_21830 [Rhodococcus sp. WB1]